MRTSTTAVLAARREEILAALARGESIRETAQRYGVGASTLRKWRRKQHPEERRSRVEERRLNALEDAVLMGILRSGRRTTYAEVREELAAKTGQWLPMTTLQRTIGRLGYAKAPAARARPREATGAAPSPAPPSVEAAAPSPPVPTRYQDHHRIAPPEGRYPSDLTDAEWALAEPIFAAPRATGRPSVHARRTMLEAILYVLRTGCPWRHLPHDFPNWNAVYATFRRWTKEGHFQRWAEVLTARDRQEAHCAEMATVGIVDSQSVKTTEKGGLAATMGPRSSWAASAASS